MKEKLPIGDAFGEDATPEENGRIMREIEEWLREARAIKREQKIIDWLAVCMLCSYIAAVISTLVLSMIWPTLYWIGAAVFGGSLALNIALVVAELIANYRRLKSCSALYEQHDNTMS